MKYWTISFPGECGQHVVETWSEKQIILSPYFLHWCEQMTKVGKQDEISIQRCLDDWIVVHWAVETDQWGNKIEHLQGSVQERSQEGSNN